MAAGPRRLTGRVREVAQRGLDTKRLGTPGDTLCPRADGTKLASDGVLNQIVCASKG